MTRKQHRRWKKQNLEMKKDMERSTQERPEWADEVKATQSFENWRTNFLKEIKESISKNFPISQEV